MPRLEITSSPERINSDRYSAKKARPEETSKVRAMGVRWSSCIVRRRSATLLRQASPVKMAQAASAIATSSQCAFIHSENAITATVSGGSLAFICLKSPTSFGST